jgi:endonuclease-3
MDVLDDLFPNPPIPLRHADTYTLLVAAILSARATDAMVNRVTPALFAKAATPGDMVKLAVPEIREIIRPCGLSPAKARNIRDMSQLILDRHAGQVPSTFAALEELPGVGHKVASVIMSQAFNVPAFPIDTHIHRLAYRWGLSDGRSVTQTERDLKAVFPRESWIRLHLQIIYYGRSRCPARSHDLARCPICTRCGVKARM